MFERMKVFQYGTNKETVGIHHGIDLVKTLENEMPSGGTYPDPFHVKVNIHANVGIGGSEKWEGSKNVGNNVGCTQIGAAITATNHPRTNPRCDFVNR